jgi:hypothetical protein
MPSKSTAPKTASKGKNAKKNADANAVVENIKVEITEPVIETAPDFSDDDEPEEVETINEVVNTEEPEESDDDDIEAQIKALQLKKLEKELKKNIIPLRKEYAEAFKSQLTQAEQRLKNLNEEIDRIKQSIIDVESGSFDEMLMNAEKAKLDKKPQTKNAVKKDDTEKRQSTSKNRPKNIAECFKRNTLLHHNKSGIDAYAMVYSCNGSIYACDENGVKIDGINIFKTINAFTNYNYEEKNKTLAKPRTTRNNAYIELKYKNDDGVWCSCDDLVSGKILTEQEK